MLPAISQSSATPPRKATRQARGTRGQLNREGGEAGSRATSTASSGGGAGVARR
ncbi:MAG TPA: hypothetical protein VF805_08345 [Anaeromyxobacteraceae bacterium]